MELYKYSSHRNTSYLKWLRTQKCIASGQDAECAHHIRLGTNGGKGIKPSDYFCIPLTNEYHTIGSFAVHRMGEESFLSHFKIDKVQFFIHYLEQFLLNYLEIPIDKTKTKNLEYLNTLIEVAEDNNKTVKKVKKKVLKKKVLEKVSITENEYYQKAKEFKREKDKELRKSLKKITPKQKVKLPKSKIKASETEFYQTAKELQKDYAKKLRDKNKQKMSEYRKEQYKEAKKRAKELKKPK